MNNKIISKMQIGKWAAVILIAVLVAPAAWSSVLIYTPVSESASSEFYPQVNTINGSGLAFTTPTTITSIADLPKHDQNQANMWITFGTTSGTITFDLGSTKTIDTLYVWNYAEGSGGNPAFLNRGSSNVTIYADNTANPTTFVQSFVFNKAAPSALTPQTDFNTPVDAYTLASPVTARYIKFDIATNWGDPSFVGLSEVRFGDTIAAVPEPTTFAMLGLGGLIVGRRMRSARAKKNESA